MVEHSNRVRKPRRKNLEQQRREAAMRRRQEEERQEREIQQARRENQLNIRNSGQLIKNHYNKITRESRNVVREQLSTFKLRNYNNAIKYMLFGRFIKAGDRVLDIGCGKGGDLFKYNKCKISELLGIDISDYSIKEAFSRYTGMRYRSFCATFVTANPFKTKIPDILEGIGHIPNQIQFPMDAVSMQFCLHYAFESEEQIRMMLENVSKSLKVGGYFFGTIPSSDFIIQKIQVTRKNNEARKQKLEEERMQKQSLEEQNSSNTGGDREETKEKEQGQGQGKGKGKEQDDVENDDPFAPPKEEETTVNSIKEAETFDDEEIKWGNSIYSVTFPKVPNEECDFSPPWGNVYYFYLKDSVENAPEFVVPFESFRAIAEEYRLELRYKKTFAELFKEEIPEWFNNFSPKMLEGLKRSDGKYGISGEEAEVADFYLAFAFERI
ncbi:mRNA (guanine-N7)-methyltransferase [Ascoidea rubescens DSM 1968]|uniref:mRNA cap guanine-N(7) methyltransferase n=1 Tax=Ascoidea rubescens DSM 1968 TaxID=1344418 RepID=A0A1D2VMG7_9ASCO|nr:guanine-N(7)-methyltransferase [Ascoidea rubescens DSM 1968]ODV62800.1 guanine-N(7)-methyltransferase [Ascoidea rubescens DSM 1968]